jgi:hypothetical protein
MLLAALVAGCGGGGGDGGGQPSGAGTPGTFDVQAAVSAMFQTAATYDMSGSVQSGTTTVALHEIDTFVPGAPPNPQVGAYLATQLVRKGDPVSAPVGATAPASGTETYYFSPSPFRLVAYTRIDGVLEHVTTTGDLPTSATIGQSGPLGTINVDQSTSVDFLGWNVQAAERPDLAWVCLTFGYRQITQSQCVRVGANGTILGGRVVNDGPLLGLTVDMRSALP